MGTVDSPGTIVTTVVGDVIAPDVGEVEMGTSLRDVIDAVGSGLADGRSVKAVFSGCRQRRRHRRAPRRARHLRGLRRRRQRHGIGRLHRLRRHHLHGRRRLPVLTVPVGRVVRPVPALQARIGRDHPAPRATRNGRRPRARTSMPSSGGSATSPTGAAATSPSRSSIVVDSILRAFPEEFDEHVDLGRCPRPRRLPIPKLLDLADGHATYDETILAQAPRLDLRPGLTGAGPAPVGACQARQPAACPRASSS